MMCPRLSVVRTSSIVLLLLVAVGVDAQKSYMSDAAMTCKQQYRLQCLKKDINNPSFKDPICVKHTRCSSRGCWEDYYTYPKGACGLADICWNPTLTLVKHEICDYNDKGCSAGIIPSSKYQFYRRLAEKLPCPRSGGRKVRYLQHCARPYDCAMDYHTCYADELFMPDASRGDVYQMCYKLCVTKRNMDGCAYQIYLTYTRPSCLSQDKCWEPNLYRRDENDFERHCSHYAITRLGGELLRGRISDNSRRRPFVFGRGR